MAAILPAGAGIFDRTNLVAWCIVPFDAKKRGPEERAQMLEKLGLRRLAYDYRAEHIPFFDAEVEACKKHRIEFTAWWFPTVLNEEARKILEVIERHRVQPQLWVMQGPEAPAAATQSEKISHEVRRLKPISEAAARLGCQVGLYNHGGWFGEPTNQLAIIRELQATNVGIVFNFHHGHEFLGRFPQMFREMKPHLLAVNLNGMVAEGDRVGKKILHLGEGDRELEMLRVMEQSGWNGAVGIIDHRPETDSAETLGKNLRGLDELLRRLRN